jgi:hypothetical protein
LSGASISPEHIDAIGIANQRETTVIWDRATGAPLAPAIVWQSRQSVPQVEAIDRRGMTGRYQAVTGLVPDAYFSATKLGVALRDRPGAASPRRSGRILFGTVETWLIWNLSGGHSHVTDIANASRTMLLDLATGDWSEELLADLGIPRSVLPRVVGNAEHLCTVRGDRFGAELQVTGSAGDQQASLFGHDCVTPGEAKNTYGTGFVPARQCGHRPEDFPAQVTLDGRLADPRRDDVRPRRLHLRDRLSGSVVTRRIRDHCRCVRRRTAGRERAGQRRSRVCPGVDRDSAPLVGLIGAGRDPRHTRATTAGPRSPEQRWKRSHFRRATWSTRWKPTRVLR